MDTNNESSNEVKMKKIGTRQEVFKGLALRTAGGLKKDDIIGKQFGSRILYISKRLSDRMRENFQHINNFRKRSRKTLVAPQHQESNNNSQNDNNRNNIGQKTPSTHSKTLKFKVNDNTVKNIYYKELQGINIKKLKDELKKEEAEEDLGIPINEIREFKIEDVPEISLNDLE